MKLPPSSKKHLLFTIALFDDGRLCTSAPKKENEDAPETEEAQDN